MCVFKISDVQRLLENIIISTFFYQKKYEDQNMVGQIKLGA